MKTKKRIKWVTLHLLGIGIALGSTLEMQTGYAQELIISNGETVVQDVIGVPGETDEVKMDQSSIWQGNLSVDQAGGAEINISEDSQWEGDVSVNAGYVHVEMTDSTWNGDVDAVGDQENGYPADINVNLINSDWIGNTTIEGGNFYAYLAENSSLSGDVQVTNGYSHFGIADSSNWEGSYSITTTEGYASGYVDISEDSLWKGDANIFIDAGDQHGNFGTNINNNSQWQGNIKLSTSGDVTSYGLHTNVSIYDNSSWMGNADLTGSFHASLGTNSHWQGNVKIENGEYSQSSGNYVSIYDSSSWQGSIDLTHKNPDYMNSMYVNVGTNSQWVGDMKATGNVTASMSMYDSSYWQGNLELNYENGENDYISQSSINLGTNSQWIGNMTVSGDVFTYAYIYDNSLWVGDLDISKNTLGEEHNEPGVGDVYITDQSTWQGKIINGDSRGIVLHVENESNWNITGSSKLAHFSTDNSTISFLPQGTGEFSTLTVNGNFDSNNVLYKMNTDFARNQGDLLVINGEITGENNLIQVNNQGDAWVDPERELTIIKTQEGAEADYFVLSNAVEVGGFEYGMKQVGNNWVLYSDDRRPTQPAQAGIKLFEGSYLLNYAETQTLMQRMGELRGSENSQGIWARVYGGKFTSSSRGFLDGYKMNYTGLQVGRDKKFDLGENKGDIYVGGMFGYGKGSLDYGVGSGNVDSKTLGLYGTYIHPSGFYTDAVLKYNRMNNDYKVLDSAGIPVKGDDINADGVHFSLEVGQRIHLDRQAKSGWYIEPQAQISVGRVTGGDFTASNGLRVHVDDYNTVLGRVGMLAGYEVKGGNNPINVYGKVSYVHEFNGDMGYRLNGISVNDSFGDSWIVYGVGASAQIGKNHNLYLDIERASGGQFNQPWAINGGYRFTW